MDKAETMEKTASAVNAAMINLAPSCDPEALERLSADIIKALKTVYDPEIPADIYELGLIYRIDISDDGYVDIDMTLTAPGCGMGPSIASDAQRKILTVPGVTDAQVDVVWDPPWSAERISQEGKAKLGMI